VRAIPDLSLRMRPLVLLTIVSTCALAGCNRAPAPDGNAASPATAGVPAAATQVAPAPVAPPPSAAAPAPAQVPAPMPEGSFASYQCDDGVQVDVHFNGIAATVAWPDGRTAQLSQSKSTAKGGPQVYSNLTVRIERAEDGLHLRDGGNAETLCTETQASA
jgi:hypothetical protein